MKTVKKYKWIIGALIVAVIIWYFFFKDKKKVAANGSNVLLPGATERLRSFTEILPIVADGNLQDTDPTIHTEQNRVIAPGINTTLRKDD